MKVESSDVKGVEIIGVLLQRNKDIPIEVAKEAWRTSMLEAARRRGVDTENSQSPFLTIDMACGSRAVYQTFEDIPAEDVPCPCGNPNHWLIKYSID